MATAKLSAQEKLRRQQARIAKRMEVNAIPPIAAPTTQDDDALEPSSDGVEVSIVESGTPPRKVSLKERIAAMVKQPDEGKGKPRRKVKTEDNLLLKSLPTLTSLLLFGSHYLVSEDYKKCAPTREEVSDMLAPVLRIAARRYKLVGEVSEDTLDIWAMMTALVMYSTRAGMQAIAIKQVKQQEQEEDAHGDSKSDYRGGYRSQGTAIRDIRATGGASGRDQEVSRASNDGQGISGHSEDDASGDDGGIRDLLARTRQRDFEYRQRQGII